MKTCMTDDDQMFKDMFWLKSPNSRIIAGYDFIATHEASREKITALWLKMLVMRSLPVSL